MAAAPHWEHGYRCHGLWRGNDRLGCVSLGPPGLWDGVYRWMIDARPADPSGQAATLRAAKRAVERALGLAAIAKAERASHR